MGKPIGDLKNEGPEWRSPVWGSRKEGPRVGKPGGGYIGLIDGQPE